MEKIDKLQKLLSNFEFNENRKEELKKNNFYYEKQILKFKKELLEIPIPSHSLILFGETGKGKTLLLRYWNEILEDKSSFVYEPDLISELNSFDFSFKNLEWLYKKYLIFDEAFDISSHKSMTENGKKNYLSLLEKLLYRTIKPIMLLSTNHINFSLFNQKIERRWKDLLITNEKIKTREMK